MAAFHLKEALNEAGFKVWWQEEIQCGQEWHGEIDRAIVEAGAIIVLWSKQSMRSQWVKHEASQAIVRSVYAPVRIEPMEIESPYDRIQATDLIKWEGDTKHAGFQNLNKRLVELMPPPVPVWKHTLLFLWKYGFSLAVSGILVFALILLLKQSQSMKVQVEAQKKINHEITRTLQPLENFNVSVDLLLDKNTPGLNEYVKYLESDVFDSVTQKIIPESLGGAFISMAGENKKPLVVTITDPRLKPHTFNSTSDLAYVTEYVDLALNFRLDSSIVQLEYFDQDSSDLSIDIRADHPDLTWNIETDELMLHFNDVPDPKFWRSTGRVVSVPDLESSNLKVELMSTVFPSLEDRVLMDKITSIRTTLKLKYLIISYSGRDLFLDGDKMIAGKGFANMPTFTIPVKEGKLKSNNK